jgi:hypothetical protein
MYYIHAFMIYDSRVGERKCIGRLCLATFIIFIDLQVRDSHLQTCTHQPQDSPRHFKTVTCPGSYISVQLT